MILFMDSSFFWDTDLWLISPRNDSFLYSNQHRSQYWAGTCAVTSWSMRFSWFWKLTSRINIIVDQFKLWMSLKSVSGVCHLRMRKPPQDPQFIRPWGLNFSYGLSTLFVEVKNMYFFSDIMHKSRKLTNYVRTYMYLLVYKDSQSTYMLSVCL